MTTARTSSLLSRGLLHSFGRADGGVVAVMFAVLLPVLIGILALGVEIGLRQMEQRKLQHAADAAAISGAIGRFETGYSSDSNNELRALTFHVAAQGGFSVGDGRTALRPYSENSDPDVYELRFVDDDRVEVRLRRERPGLFSRIFPGGGGAMISARAEAGLAGDPPGEPFCFLGRERVRVQGGGNNPGIEIPGCRLASNQDFEVDGNPDDIIGECAAQDQASIGCTEGWMSGSDFPEGGFADRIGYIEERYPGICDYTSENDFAGTLMPGVYCVEGGQKWNISGNMVNDISGDDITIIIGENSELRFAGSGSGQGMNISAPTSGNLEGVLIYGLEGSEFIMRGNSTLSAGCSGVIADKLDFGGNPSAVMGGGSSCDLQGGTGAQPGGGEISLLQ